MKPSILVVDDNRDLAAAVALVLSGLSDDVVVTHSAEEALHRLAEAPTDLVFSDVCMPGLSGLDLLERVREREPRARTILFTAYGSVEAAVDAMRRGAYDYLTKPFDHDELLLVAGRAWKEIEDEDELERLRA